MQVLNDPLQMFPYMNYILKLGEILQELIYFRMVHKYY